MHRLLAYSSVVMLVFVAACDTNSLNSETEGVVINQSQFAQSSEYKLGGEPVTAFEFADGIRQESFDRKDDVSLYQLKVSMTPEELARLPEDRREKIESIDLEVDSSGTPLKLLKEADQFNELTILHDGEPLDAEHFIEHLTEEEVALLDIDLKKEIVKELESQDLLADLEPQKRSLLEVGE